MRNYACCQLLKPVLGRSFVDCSEKVLELVLFFIGFGTDYIKCGCHNLFQKFNKYIFYLKRKINIVYCEEKKERVGGISKDTFKKNIEILDIH